MMLEHNNNSLGQVARRRLGVCLSERKMTLKSYPYGHGKRPLIIQDSRMLFAVASAPNQASPVRFLGS